MQSSQYSAHSARHSLSPAAGLEKEGDLLERFQREEKKAGFYRNKCRQMRSINESIVAAIKRVFSEEVGQELEKAVEECQRGFSVSCQQTDIARWTHTFCQRMVSYNSKLPSEQSVALLPLRPPASPKYDNSPQRQYPQYCQQVLRSSSRNNNSSRIGENRDGSVKAGNGDFSTRRSYTPIRPTIATEMLCEVCDRVFPPNEFVSHAERCSQAQSRLSSETVVVTPRGAEKQLNYGQVMSNLLEIREQIEEHIRLINGEKDRSDRAQIRKNLEKDLRMVIKVISQKEEELRHKKRDKVAAKRLVRGVAKMR